MDTALRSELALALLKCDAELTNISVELVLTSSWAHHGSPVGLVHVTWRWTCATELLAPALALCWVIAVTLTDRIHSDGWETEQDVWDGDDSFMVLKQIQSAHLWSKSTGSPYSSCSHLNVLVLVRTVSVLSTFVPLEENQPEAYGAHSSLVSSGGGGWTATRRRVKGSWSGSENTHSSAWRMRNICLIVKRGSEFK